MLTFLFILSFVCFVGVIIFLLANQSVKKIAGKEKNPLDDKYQWLKYVPIDNARQFVKEQVANHQNKYSAYRTIPPTHFSDYESEYKELEYIRNLLARRESEESNLF